MKEWEDELFQGAVLQKTATFTLALDKARQKLEKFQLPNPIFYILQILQAIIASGASSIKVVHDHAAVVDRSTLTFFFDGPGYSRDELAHLNDFLFESGRSREKDRTREMALGIVSCVALKPHSMRLACGGYQWERKNQQERVVEVSATAAEAEATAKGVRKGGFTNLLEVVRSGPAPEKDLLRTHCYGCPIDLTLNERYISSKENVLNSACPWPNFEFKEGEFHGFFGIGYGQLEKSSLTLLRYGVQYTRRFEARIYPPLVLVCEHPDLRKNASQSDVVEDTHYLKFLTDLSRIQRDFSLRLATERVPTYQRDLVQQYLLAYFEQYLPPNLAGLDLQQLEPDLQKIIRLPLFTGTTGKRYSLENVVSSYKTDGILLLSGRMRPRSTVNDIVILTPSEWERPLLVRLFENTANVDERFDELVGQIRGRRALKTTELPELLAETTSMQLGNLELRLAVPDSPIAPEMHFYYPDEGGLYHRAPIPVLSLSAIVYVNEPPRRSVKTLVTEIGNMVQPQIEALYTKLWERLRLANRKPKFAGKIARATDHLANAILYLHLLVPGEVLPEPFGTARFLEDRQGRLVSLADLKTWLEVYPQVVLTLGGPAFADDFALKSSPEIRRLVEALFGASKILEATLENPHLKERELQRPLASCADGPTLLIVHEETEEEELARLKLEYEEAKKGEPEAPKARPAPVIEADGLAPLPPSAPQDPVEAYFTEFRGLKKMFSAPFNQADVTGELAVCTSFDKPEELGKITIFTKQKFVGLRSCGDLPVSGWLACDRPISEEDIEGALVQLYIEAARLLQAGGDKSGPRPEEMLRRMLFQFFAQRPHLAQLKGPLTEVPLLPQRNGSPTSLGDVRRSAIRLGFVPFCLPGDTLPSGEMNALLVTPPVTEELLQKLFKVPVKRIFKENPDDRQEQLLQQIRRLLGDLSGVPEANLDHGFVSSVSWGEPTSWFGSRKKYFVEHLSNGLTEMNPGHSLVKAILRSKEGTSRMAPVLASSVYTAINRALHEIEDVNELAFLEALLDRI